MTEPTKPADTKPVTPEIKAAEVKGAALAEKVAEKAAKPSPVSLKPVAAPPFTILDKEGRHNERYIKMLAYGEHGSGKTYLMATACSVPRMNDVIMISAEGGEMTIDTDDKSHPFHKIDSIRIEDFNGVAKTFDFLKLHCDLRDRPFDPAVEEKLWELEAKNKQLGVAELKAKQEKPRRYQTTIIDSLTEVESYCMSKILDNNPDMSLDEVTETAEWKHYKIQHTTMMNLIRRYRDLPMHVLMTCARQYIQDESKRQLFSPAMTGKLTSKVQGFVDIVGYLEVLPATTPDGNPPRKMHVQPNARWNAKNRISSYKKPFFEDPTMAKILKEIGMTK